LFGAVALDRVQSLVENELGWVRELEDEPETDNGELK
jgi:hypothetical protein